MKLILLFVNTLLIFQIGFCQELSNKVRFIAGFPDYIYRPVDQGEIYTSAILKIEGDSLIEECLLTDSLQYLNFLRSYPDYHYVICMAGNKLNKNNYNDFKDYNLILYDISTGTKRNVLIPSKYQSKGIDYDFYHQTISSSWINNELEIILEYSNFKLPKNGSHPRLIYCTFNPMSKEIKEVTPEIYRNIIACGNYYLLKNNYDGLLLLGDVDNNVLRIPANENFFKKPIYIENLPDNVKIKTDYIAGTVLINNNQTLVLYLYEMEKQPKWNKIKLRVLDKGNSSWSYFTVETSIISLKSFERWLGGNSMVREAYKNNEVNNMTFKEGDWIKKETQFGPSYPSLIDADESYKFYSEGNLYLYNIDSKTTIRWETGCGDSEILLVHNEVVYYRVNDKIYKTPIINGKELSNSQLLIQDGRVADIHWAFMSEK